MDFVRRHGNEDDYIASHEQFRGVVFFNRTEAAIALALERRRPEEAIDALRDGVERLTNHQRTWWDDHDAGRIAQSRADRAAPGLRTGDPQEIRRGKDAAGTARRRCRPRRLRTGGQTSRPDSGADPRPAVRPMPPWLGVAIANIAPGRFGA